jgi:tetratricopeptide (TPR) repeat protein
MNWKSVIEHEFLHILTLQKSGYRISRWLTEGISSSLESSNHADWSLLFCRWESAGRLLRAEELDSGFLCPVNTEQVAVSYYQAALTCEYLSSSYGPDTLNKMTESYGMGKNTEEILCEITGKELSDLNGELKRYYHKRAVELKKRASSFSSEIKELTEKLKIKSKSGNRKWLLPTDYYIKKGEYGRAEKILLELSGLDNSDYMLYKKLAEIYVSENKAVSAEKALQEALYRNPFDKGIIKMLKKAGSGGDGRKKPGDEECQKAH